MRRSICIIVCSAMVLVLIAGNSINSDRASAQSQSVATEEPRFTPPPAEENPEIKNLIDKAQAALAGGGISQRNLLADPEYMPAHAYPRFRGLIRQYGAVNQTTLVTPHEPGEPLVVSGYIRNGQGQPIPGAVIYVYQTSAKGWYSDKAPHISGMAGDQRHARLFGYLKTNRDGRYEFRTIRPAGYPRSNLPAHIHIEIEIAGNDRRSLISEILFEDDPRLTKEMRDRSLRERLFIFPVTREPGGMQRLEATFQIER